MWKSKKQTSTVAVAKKKRMSWNLRLFIIFCCAVPVINWLVFYIHVNLSSFQLAFLDVKGNFSLVNFERFYRELTSETSDLRLAFKNTLLTFAIGTVYFPIQVLVSYFIYKKVPGSGLWRILFFLPRILFGVATSMIVIRMLSVRGFVAEGVKEMLQLSQVPDLLADSRYANITVLVHLFWLSFPGDLIIWGGTFARIPEDVLESARIDGVTWWQEFTKIIVPIVWPTFALTFVLRFCGLFGATGDAFLLTGGEFGTMTLSCWMFLEALGSTGGDHTNVSFAYLSAVGMVLTVISVAISLVIRKWTDKVFADVEY